MRLGKVPRCGNLGRAELGEQSQTQLPWQGVTRTRPVFEGRENGVRLVVRVRARQN